MSRTWITLVHWSQIDSNRRPNLASMTSYATVSGQQRADFVVMPTLNIKWSNHQRWCTEHCHIWSWLNGTFRLPYSNIRYVSSRIPLSCLTMLVCFFISSVGTNIHSFLLVHTLLWSRVSSTLRYFSPRNFYAILWICINVLWTTIQFVVDDSLNISNLLQCVRTNVFDSVES